MPIAAQGSGDLWDPQAKVWLCSMDVEEVLTAELAWLKAVVYGGWRV